MGGEDGTKGIGGAWHCAATFQTGESGIVASTACGTTAVTTWPGNMPGPDEGCTKGDRSSDMVRQQSRPWWPCDEQGIERQQRIACSGVVMARQSDPYAANATVRTAKKTGLALRIFLEARRFGTPASRRCPRCRHARCRRIPLGIVTWAVGRHHGLGRSRGPETGFEDP